MYFKEFYEKYSSQMYASRVERTKEDDVKIYVKYMVLNSTIFNEEELKNHYMANVVKALTFFHKEMENGYKEGKVIKFTKKGTHGFHHTLDSTYVIAEDLYEKLLASKVLPLLIDPDNTTKLGSTSIYVFKAKQLP
jgi:hypothetical protein